MEATTLQATPEGLSIALDPAWEGLGAAGVIWPSIATLKATSLSVPQSPRPVSLQAQFLAKAERA
jgi:hypothetical protein